jgi:hypothetical protein
MIVLYSFDNIGSIHPAPLRHTQKVDDIKLLVNKKNAPFVKNAVLSHYKKSNYK